MIPAAPFAVSRAERAHREAVVSLLAVQMSEHRIPATPESIGRAVDGLLDATTGHGCILIAARPGGPVLGVACLSYIWTVEHGGKAAWLEELYVSPAARECGTGSALLEAALAEAGRAGCGAVDLEVDVEHRRVESLYRRHGFRAHTRTHWVKSPL